MDWRISGLLHPDPEDPERRKTQPFGVEGGLRVKALIQNLNHICTVGVSEFVGRAGLFPTRVVLQQRLGSAHDVTVIIDPDEKAAPRLIREGTHDL